MVRVHAEPVGPDKALVSREELGKLIEAADDLPAAGLMRIAAEGGSFQFLDDPREDLYTVNDLKVRYR